MSDKAIRSRRRPRAVDFVATDPEQGAIHTLAPFDPLRPVSAIKLGGIIEISGKAAAEQPGPEARSVLPLQKWRLKRVVEYIDNHLSGKISLLDLAAVAGLSRMHFAAQFRKATGSRPHDYLVSRRIGRAEELLRTTSLPIVEIALTVGFQTQAHFTTVFKRFAGYPPCRWRTIGRVLPAGHPDRPAACAAPAD